MNTAAAEASEITGVEQDERIRQLQAKVASLRAELLRKQTQLKSTSSSEGHLMQLASSKVFAARGNARHVAALDDPRRDDASHVQEEETVENREGAKEEELLDQDLNAYQSQFLIKGV